MKNNKIKWLSFILLLVVCAAFMTACKEDKQTQSGVEAEKEPLKEEPSKEEPEEIDKKGTILWLSNLSSGPQFEASLAYGEYVCEQLGYKLQVIYGDSFNEPSKNLMSVTNAMTDDVVGLIASQDGGIINILEEYPDLYIAGYNTEMASVYEEGGPSEEAAKNDHFLGTIADGFVRGEDDGARYAEIVIERGYKKVCTIISPPYAYPQATRADKEFRAIIGEYNKTAEEPIEIVDDAKIIEFALLEDNYFMSEKHADLDCIIARCSGVRFVYPTLKNAIEAGNCSADTKMLTAGYEEDGGIIDDVGGDGVIQYIHVSATENIAYPICLLDAALSGEMYADYTKSEPIDGMLYEIDSLEDVENTKKKSVLGTKKATDSPLTLEEIKEVLPRFNSEATYASLKELFASEQLTAEYLENN